MRLPGSKLGPSWGRGHAQDSAGSEARPKRFLASEQASKGSHATNIALGQQHLLISQSLMACAFGGRRTMLSQTEEKFPANALAKRTARSARLVLQRSAVFLLDNASEMSSLLQVLPLHSQGSSTVSKSAPVSLFPRFGTEHMSLPDAEIALDVLANFTEVLLILLLVCPPAMLSSGLSHECQSLTVSHSKSSHAGQALAIWPRAISRASRIAGASLETHSPRLWVKTNGTFLGWVHPSFLVYFSGD